jgi:hypothetical protein
MENTKTTFDPRRSALVWISIALIAYLFFNVMQAILTPGTFAERFGTPIADISGQSFVRVYAIRTLFIAIFATLLIATRQFMQLSTFLIVAVLMPVGDAMIVASAGGESTIILRHLAIAGVVTALGVLLRRAALQQSRSIRIDA